MINGNMSALKLRNMLLLTTFVYLVLPAELGQELNAKLIRIFTHFKLCRAHMLHKLKWVILLGLWVILLLYKAKK